MYAAKKTALFTNVGFPKLGAIFLWRKWIECMERNFLSSFFVQKRQIPGAAGRHQVLIPTLPAERSHCVDCVKDGICPMLGSLLFLALF